MCLTLAKLSGRIAGQSRAAVETVARRQIRRHPDEVYVLPRLHLSAGILSRILPIFLFLCIHLQI